MGKHTRTVVDPPKAESVPSGKPDQLLIIRIAVAMVIFLVSLILKNLPPFLSVILLAASALIAGYDLILKIVEAVQEGNYFISATMILLVALLAFVIGSCKEGAAVVILYQFGQVAISYAFDKTRETALDLLHYQSEEAKSKASALMGEPGATDTELAAGVESALNLVLCGAMIFAALFAVVAPLLTEMRFVEGIRRALAILVVCTPLSVVAAFPLASWIGMAYGVSFGAFFTKASVIEKLSFIKQIIFDKNGVFSGQAPKLMSVESDVIDKKTFMDFVTHAVYYSEQPFARAIADAVDQEYRLDLISDFVDLPGAGVDVKIGGAPVTLGTRELFAGRGEAVPYEGKNDHPIYYLMVAGKYIGKVELTDALNTDSSALIGRAKEQGIEKCSLLTEEGKDESERLGTSLDADEVYAECDADKKLLLVQKLTEAQPYTLYVYAAGIETHSAALLDLRVSQRSKYADLLLYPEYVGDLPAVLKLARRMREIMLENVMFAYLVKVLLIYLSILGKLGIWFALFIDLVAALVTFLNCVRITKDPLVDLSRLPVRGEKEE